MKAKFTRQGNAWTREYCKSRGLRLNECGKVVVAQRKELVDGIHTLHQRGIRNKVDIEVRARGPQQAVGSRSWVHTDAGSLRSW